MQRFGRDTSLTSLAADSSLPWNGCVPVQGNIQEHQHWHLPRLLFAARIFRRVAYGQAQEQEHRRDEHTRRGTSTDVEVGLMVVRNSTVSPTDSTAVKPMPYAIPRQ